MSPDFAKAVDPVFLAVLDLLSRIEKPKPGEPDFDPVDENNRIREHLDRAETQLGSRHDEWLLAKYALVVWIDDVLYQAPWNGREWWLEHSLEFEYFQIIDAATEFFLRAQNAGSLRTRDALEVYYICVMLRFRGIYRDPNPVAVAHTKGLNLPETLGRWTRRTAQGIQFGQGLPPVVERPAIGEGAPALRGKFHLIGALFTMTVLGGAAFLLLYHWHQSGAGL